MIEPEGSRLLAIVDTEIKPGVAEDELVVAVERHRQQTARAGKDEGIEAGADAGSGGRHRRPAAHHDRVGRTADGDSIAAAAERNPVAAVAGDHGIVAVAK